MFSISFVDIDIAEIGCIASSGIGVSQSHYVSSTQVAFNAQVCILI